ncbi:MAG: hypothetical protein KatS3mg081_0847 [Gemmatimonadales bacterium]|nr:MAG: hypothetical protein KatS3mg081_0847 [Gemmatimonadales bacterium]
MPGTTGASKNFWADLRRAVELAARRVRFLRDGLGLGPEGAAYVEQAKEILSLATGALSEGGRDACCYALGVAEKFQYPDRGVAAVRARAPGGW